MKKMFALVLMISALLVPQLLRAEGDKGEIDKRVQRMSKRYDLTPEQKLKARAIVERRLKRHDELAAQKKAVNDKADADFLAILNEAQKKKYLAEKKKKEEGKRDAPRKDRRQLRVPAEAK